MLVKPGIRKHPKSTTFTQEPQLNPPQQQTSNPNKSKCSTNVPRHQVQHGNSHNPTLRASPRLLVFNAPSSSTPNPNSNPNLYTDIMHSECLNRSLTHFLPCVYQTGRSDWRISRGKRPSESPRQFVTVKNCSWRYQGLSLNWRRQVSRFVGATAHSTLWCRDVFVDKGRRWTSIFFE